MDENPVDVSGWVESVRRLKQRTFVQLRCGSMSMQRISIVIPTERLPLEGLTLESYIRVKGRVQSLPPGKYSDNDCEVLASEVEVVGASDSDYSFRFPPDTLRPLEHQHMTLRSPEGELMIRMRASLLTALRLYWTNCCEIVPPCFTGTACEGGATLFSLSHPGVSSSKPQTAYLTQSSQFALEMALPVVGDCYCIYPSFRAEHSHTRRHLTEFLHAEAEWQGCFTLDDHLQHLDNFLRGTVAAFACLVQPLLETKYPEKWQRLQRLQEQCKEIVILTHAEAIAACNARGIYKEVTPDGQPIPFGERDDIPEQQERALIDALDQIVFLVKFPREIKSFYMALDPDDPSRVLGCDVEVPGVGEIIGSGVREHDEARLLARMQEAQLDPADYREYLELRRYGAGRTGGMGVGVDRLLMWLMGESDIRRVVTFPRFPGYLRP